MCRYMFWINIWRKRMNHIKIQKVMTPYGYEEDLLR